MLIDFFIAYMFLGLKEAFRFWRVLFAWLVVVLSVFVWKGGMVGLAFWGFLSFLCVCVLLFGWFILFHFGLLHFFFPVIE